MGSAPPPYSEGVSLRNNNIQQPRSLARKPVPGREDEASREKQQATAAVARRLDRLDLEDEVPTSNTKSTAMQRRPLTLDQSKLSNDVAISSRPLASQVEGIQSAVPNDESDIKRPPLSQTVTSTSTSSFTSQLSTTSSHLQNAYREARHFAGGLIHHPAESTKHFSILRHSHGLVFYQGTSTSVVVSIFSDAPLPSNRTIWLQNKGWTGKTGMGLRSLVGRTGSWLDVTPTVRATAEQLKPSDERAWQRDIGHFLKRASDHTRQSQRLRETIIIRIPVQAQDGYFRLVLCAEGNKKVLCPSPVFRILSTSTDPSSLRGASLSTLPLELGVKLATNVANTVMQSRVTQPLTSAVQTYMPSWVGKATTAYDATAAEKVDTVVGNVNGQYNVVRQTSFNHLGGEFGAHDEGPQPPYPVYFPGDAGLGVGVIGMPVANLNKVPEIILLRLFGFYFGWVRIVPNKKSDPGTPDQQWYQAVISALPIKTSELARVRIEDAGKKVINVLFIDEDQGFTSFGSSQIEVRVLGFLRPHEEISENEAEAAAKAAAEAEMLEAVNDVMSTQALLSRPAWGPEARPTGIETEDGESLQKVRSRIVDSRLATQRRVDSIPLHKAGVRVAVDVIREESLNAGGIYIPR